jgi:hypothetical protein
MSSNATYFNSLRTLIILHGDKFSSFVFACVMIPSIIATTACRFLPDICFHNAGIASNRPTGFTKNLSPVASLLSILLHHCSKSTLKCGCWFTFLNDSTQAYGFTFLSASIHTAIIVACFIIASFLVGSEKIEQLSDDLLVLFGH